ncbi:energy-coupling factor transporter transmembrane component T family protein [Acidobacteriota bacterium]
MKHDFIDKYCHLDSPLHGLDPRGKLFICLSLLVIFISTTNLKLFAIYFALLLFLVILSRVPVSYYLKRALLVTPFVLMIVLFMLASAALSPASQNQAYLHATLIILKTYASILLLTMLTSVTRFQYLLWAMRKFKFPTVMTTLSRLVYTYTFLLIDELHAARRAIKSRAPVIRMPKTKVYGNVAASILLKSIHRSRVVYYAMVSRKFSGEFPEGEASRFGRADIIAGTFFILFILGVFLLWNV